jgi:hypothetical protein
MNEFTQDELIKLKNGLEYLPNSVSISSDYWNECQKIINKINFIIDNYDAQVIDAWHCEKCGHVQ